jgi:hypothetical protein
MTCFIDFTGNIGYSSSLLTSGHCLIKVKHTSPLDTSIPYTVVTALLCVVGVV